MGGSSIDSITMNEPQTTTGQQTSCEKITDFGGDLIRTGKNSWLWRDGTPALNVRDMHPSWKYDVRFRFPYIEVQLKQVRNEPELAWVTALNYERAESAYDGRCVFVYRVPVEEWVAWDAEKCVGAYWEPSETPSILAKSESIRAEMAASFNEARDPV